MSLLHTYVRTASVFTGKNTKIFYNAATTSGVGVFEHYIENYAGHSEEIIISNLRFALVVAASHDKLLQTF